MKNIEKQIHYLSELSDYTIDGGYPDVRKWEVKDSALRTIGTVKNLLVNIKTERVVYLDVEVDASIIDARHDPYGKPINIDIREFINDDGENHVIIPIGLVDINMEQKYVFTESIDHRTFAETKRKRSDAPIQRDYETAVLDSYGRRYVHQPLGKQSDTDIENLVDKENMRMEKIKQRHKIGEYGDKEMTSEITKDEVDWYDASSEGLKSPDELDDDFYRRKEFDNPKFHRGKK